MRKATAFERLYSGDSVFLYANGVAVELRISRIQEVTTYTPDREFITTLHVTGNPKEGGPEMSAPVSNFACTKQEALRHPQKAAYRRLHGDPKTLFHI